MKSSLIDRLKTFFIIIIQNESQFSIFILYCGRDPSFRENMYVGLKIFF